MQNSLSFFFFDTRSAKRLFKKSPSDLCESGAHGRDLRIGKNYHGQSHPVPSQRERAAKMPLQWKVNGTDSRFINVAHLCGNMCSFYYLSKKYSESQAAN